MSPLLDEVLTWVRSQIKSPDPSVPINDTQRRDAALVRRVLSTDDGEALLMLLARLSVLRPALDPSLTGEASHEFAQRRTGENQLFAALIHYRDLAETLERTPDARHAYARPDPDADPRADADAGPDGIEGISLGGWDEAGLVAGR